MFFTYVLPFKFLTFRFLQLPAGTTFDKLLGVKKPKSRSVKDVMPRIGPKKIFMGYHSDGLPLSVAFQVWLKLIP